MGSTPLHVACGEGHMPAVVKLIESGCDPAIKDCDGCTPLYCAAAWNQIEVVRYLHQLVRLKTCNGIPKVFYSVLTTNRWLEAAGSIHKSLKQEYMTDSGGKKPGILRCPAESTMPHET